MVKNADGSLTGYFDYRPKDADEALLAASSTDGGKSWTYEGEALEQNPGYCPSADINDDGQGHANLITVGGVTRLYTLQRPAGDSRGSACSCTRLSPTTANPAGRRPAGTEKVGIDPDAFVPAPPPVVGQRRRRPRPSPATTGTAGSTEQLVAGGFVDLTHDARADRRLSSTARHLELRHR